MSATLIQVKSDQNYASTPTAFVLTMDVATVAGHTLIASFGAEGGTASSVTDNGGNSWTRIASTIDAGAEGQRRGHLWYCIGANSATEIYVASDTSQNVVISVSEWQGVTGFRNYDMDNTVAGATKVVASAGDLVFGSCYYYRASGSPELEPEAGWTSAGSIARGSSFQSTAYRMATADGLQGPLWDYGAAGKATITAAFTTIADIDASNVHVRVDGAWKKALSYLRANGAWIPSSTGGGGVDPAPGGTGPSTIAVIGDSHVYQGGQGETRFRTGLQDAGWAASDIYWNGVNGRFIQWTDSTGSTTMEQIDNARAALSSEPLWVFILGSNGSSESDSVTDGQIDTVLAKVGAGGRVLWMNTVMETWPEANRVRRNARIAAAVDRHPELDMTVLDWATECQTLPTDNLWNSDGIHHTGYGYGLKNAWTINQITGLGYPGDGSSVPTPAGWKVMYDSTFAVDDGWTARQETQANDNSYNTPDNVEYGARGMVVHGRRENLGNRPYTSGDVLGQHIAVPNYFRAEVTATLPIEPGMWPAPLWLRPLNGSDGEIDVCETWPYDWAGDPKMYATIWENYVTKRKENAGLSYSALADPDPAAPHTYTVEKTYRRIRFEVDGVLVYEWNEGNFNPTLATWYDSIYEVPGRTWYPRVTLQIGAGNAGTSDNNAEPDPSWTHSEVVIHQLKIYEQDI